MKIVHKLSLILLFITPIVGCVNDDSDVEFISNADRDNVIDISTTRTEGNILGVNSGDIDANALPIMQYSSVKKTMQNNTRANDPFTEIREVETFESVVLPELQPHIWIGNIMTKSSIVDCNYKPLVYPRSAITVSSTLRGASPKKIDDPSFSKYLKYIEEQTGKGSFTQNEEFSFTTEQWSS